MPNAARTALHYPGKVAVDGRRIAVADSGRHRVLVGTLDESGTRAAISSIFGSERGYRDGGEPLFDSPQGLVFGGDTLHVADAGNHAIRSIDLTRGETRTLAGTGHQLRTRADQASGALSSPWDVAIADGTLFVAMAGNHRIYGVDMRDGRTRRHAGSGAEEITDGPSLEAALAQPMGICASTDRLYFTDAESSAVRWVNSHSGGNVHTLVGTGLFDFGDVDGEGDTVRLQHPQGIAAHEDGRLSSPTRTTMRSSGSSPATRHVDTLDRAISTSRAASRSATAWSTSLTRTRTA